MVATQWPHDGHTMATRWPLVKHARNGASRGGDQSFLKRNNTHVSLEAGWAISYVFYQWPSCGPRVALVWPSCGPRVARERVRTHLCQDVSVDFYSRCVREGPPSRTVGGIYSSQSVTLRHANTSHKVHQKKPRNIAAQLSLLCATCVTQVIETCLSESVDGGNPAPLFLDSENRS